MVSRRMVDILQCWGLRLGITDKKVSGKVFRGLLVGLRDKVASDTDLSSNMF